ncbi:MAG: TonB-dependent receptor [Rubrivivax sp.]
MQKNRARRRRALAPLIAAVPAALLAASSTPSFAATPAATAGAAQTVVVTAAAAAAAGPLDAPTRGVSRLGASVRETPASVTVVDRADIEAMGALDTQSVLAAIPGLSWSSQPGAPGSVFYRGFGAASVAQLYNGISVQYDAISARPVDSWIVERVEAIGGPSSFLNGAGAVGGTIDVITKIADLQGDLTQWRAAAGDTRQLALGLQRGFGTGSGAPEHVLRVELNATRGTHWAMGREREAWQAALSWRAALGRALVHTLAVERQHERVTQPYWGTPLLRDAANAVVGAIRIDPGTRGVNYNAVDGRYRQDVTWGRSILSWAISPALQATHTFYLYDALRDYENVEVYSFVNGNTQVERSAALRQRHEQQVWGSRAELTLHTRLGARRSDFAFGWDYAYNRQTRYPLSVAGPFDRTDPYRPTDTCFYRTPGVTPTLTPDATNRLHMAALFAENRTVLAPGWALTSALRADVIGLSRHWLRAPSAANPEYFDARYRPLTGRLGLVVDLAPDWQAYAQYSTAADPPAGILSTAGFSALRDFDLTRGRQWEIGSKASFDNGRGEATLALYDIVRRNLATTDPADRTRTLAVGRQSSRGVELAARWRPASAWQLGLQLAWTDAKYDDFTETLGAQTVSRAGKRPPNVPELVAGLALAWQPVARVTLSAQGRHVGRRYGNNANTVWADGYTLLDLGARWQFAPGWSLGARVYNAGDESYAASAGGNLAVLGAPRTAQLALDRRF